MTLRRLVLLLVVGAAVVGFFAPAPGYGQARKPGVQEGVRVVVPWSVAGDDLVCEVTEQGPDKPDALSTKQLIVYSKRQGRSRPLFSKETPDTPLGVIALGEYNTRLLVAWAGGSAYHFEVLALVDGRVREVLAKGARAYPEIISDEHGNELLLFTEMRLEEGEWRREHGTTDVFAWSGRGYETIGRVPWAKRLQCTSKETCAQIK